ncbi:hypothetical protein OG225_06665 [Nocardia sp. NBC_01377]|uniref:hypothetical protein n=1 Tax=Nocardia sp. NBC_01377 TaxID=2903595 RepID=UPI003244F5DF
MLIGPGTAAAQPVSYIPAHHPGLAMALIRVENAGASPRTDPDGTPRWETDPFGIGLPEFGWHLTPAEHTGSRWVLAAGWWLPVAAKLCSRAR